MNGYDQLYVDFIYYFNIKRDYFECHEVMEELWLEEGRAPLYQGLLQLAVGLYHHWNGNVGGSIKLFTQGIGKLQHLPSPTLGIDLAKIVADSEEYVNKLLHIDAIPFEFYDLNIVVVDAGLEAKLNARITELAKSDKEGDIG
jgi:predicted metal-dependent hydrolase